MKIVDKLNQAKAENRLAYSFEFFPPKTEPGMANLFDRLGRMAELKPDFISCTWGTGGSTQDRTLEVCATAQSVFGLETLMHLTCTNMEKSTIDTALQKAKQAGIQNILALRGDPPRGQEYWTPCEGGFAHAVDLVRYIRSQYGDYFCIGVAGFPEGDVGTTDPKEALVYLKAKVDAGADFIVTQLFYDVNAYATWAASCRDAGITVPIVPGIMPVPTYQSFRRIVNLCHVNVPKAIMDEINAVKGDDQKVKAYGVDLAVSMIRELLEKHNVVGVHLSTLNLERSVKLILQSLDLVPKTTHLKPSTLLQDPTRQESWDEFPNGRYGDARSPAFGDSKYGASQAIPTTEGSHVWGQPTTKADIDKLFERYILGDLATLPWCDEPLQTETDAIRQRLADINRKGFWTVGSQPAVNGVKSEDPVYGWGPRGGYVYQKAFVECFVSSDILSTLLKKLEKQPFITYLAANNKGDFLTNVVDEDQQNAVTWGVFPGKEIVQPTIIERVNFLAWRQEAFDLWSEWEKQYAPDSKTAQLLSHLQDDCWLINLVHNDFKQSNSLFEVILA